jgi:membrane protein implicated in regulation of membrane protease activity
MNSQQEEVQRSKGYERVKTICDGLLAIMSLAGGPAIVLLAFDPSIRFVPLASSDVVLLALIVAGGFVPMIPVVSFAVSAFPKALGFWPGLARIAFILVMGCVCFFVNDLAYDWHSKRNADAIASSQRIEAGRRAQSAADKEELRVLIEGAVAEKCEPSRTAP